MKITNNEVPPKILMKNNALVQARYSLSLIENRIFLLMMYKLQKENEGVLKCEITHEEFKEIIKKSKDRTIKSIDEILSSLRRKPIYFIKEKNNGHVSWGEYGFINGFEYDDETKAFYIEASEKIYSLIRNYLKNGYTPNNLAILFGIGNYYAQRMYDLLRLWSATKNIINYPVNDLKMYLNLGDKYKDYNTFKRRIIIPSINALVETGCFEINFKENKIGRKVDSIDFIVKDLDKRTYFDKNVLKEVAEYENNGNNKVLEQLKEENCINTQEKENETLKIENAQFYVPDETVFTKGTLRSVKKDFMNIDFKDNYMERAFDDAVMITLDRDDVDQIKATSYKFFKGTLDNKIIEYEKEKEEDEKHKKEMDMFW